MSEPLTFALHPAQAGLQALLLAHPWLADVSILTEQKGDIENEIDRALGVLSGIDGKSGVCIVILTPTAAVKSPNAPGPILDSLLVVLSVIENVLVNHGAQGTGKHALQLVEFLLRYLHHKPFGNAALAAKTYEIANSDPLTYKVSFETKLALAPIA